jgi:hypothetical protein
MDAHLFGIWESDPSDTSAIEQYGRARLHFFATGDLTYTICRDNLDQVIRLTYTVDGNTITTQHPSSPRAEQTKYVIEADGRLALAHNGILSWYVRKA